VSRYQKGKTNLDFTEARESEWQWNPLGHMQVCTSLQTDNHASTPPLSFLQARCPTTSVKVLKAKKLIKQKKTNGQKAYRSDDSNVKLIRQMWMTAKFVRWLGRGCKYNSVMKRTIRNV